MYAYCRGVPDTVFHIRDNRWNSFVLPRGCCGTVYVRRWGQSVEPMSSLTRLVYT